MGKGGRAKFNTLCHARSKLSDDDLPHLGLWQESTDYEEVDVSQNQLTSRGLKTVVKFCCRCPNLRIFKAYKNEIDDAGAYQLAKLLERCMYMEEIHLSHNRLTAKGVRVIVQAAEQNRHRSMGPLWLRLEQNQVSHASELLGHLANEFSVCGRGDERNCTSRHCAWKRKIHVPFLYMQRDDWKEDTSERYWQHKESYEASYEEWPAEGWPAEHSWKAAAASGYGSAVKWRPSLERFPDAPGQFIDTVKELFEQAEHEEKGKWDRRWEPKAAPEEPEAQETAKPDEERQLPVEGEGLIKKLMGGLKVVGPQASTSTTAKDPESAPPPPAPALEANQEPDATPETVQDSNNASETQEGEAEVRAYKKTRRAKKKNKMSKVSADSQEEDGRSRSDSLDTASTWDGADSKRLSCDVSESAASSAASSAGSSASAPKRESQDEEERDPGEALRAEGLPEDWGSMRSMLKLMPFAEIPNAEAMTARLERALEADKLMISAEDKKQVKDCLAALEATIKEDLEPEQQWTVEIFGSMRTGFGTKGCDLDVVIVRANAQDRETNVQKILMKLREQLEATKGVKIKNTILSARVPILKLEYSGRDVDISVNNTKALMNSRLLAAYAELDPLIPQFGVAVKLWAKDAELCGAPDGHLSSYAFILMALYFLQVASGDELPCLQDGLAETDLEDDEKIQNRVDEIKESGWKMQTGDLWMLLAGFFAFYGGSLGPTYQYEPFNWGREVISVRLGKKSRGLPLDHELLAELKGRTEGHLHIEDPVEHSRNLRDVLWHHPKDHEKQLREEISWMDQLCREQVRQQIICQWPHQMPPLGPPFAASFPDFPLPGLAPAMPWNSFGGPSLKGKPGRSRGGGGKPARPMRRAS